ncbi:MAG: hypothetical protein HY870_18880 [Chloroflexi bacterium]|nr:hypothetical protein [Chloroflexota bacterium]
MPTRPKDDRATLVAFAEKVITNGQKVPEIKAAMTEYGYTTAKYTAARGLLTTTKEGLTTQALDQGGQRVATGDEQTAKEDAFAAYQGVAKIGKKVLSPAELAQLGLPSRQPRKTADFITTAYTVFDNLLETEALADFGYTSEKIAAERAKIEAYEQADLAQAEAIGAKEQGTQDLEATFVELNTWVTTYVRVAKVALAKKPQLLEKLGIKVRSSKTAAQRAAPKKAAATKAAKKAVK